MTAHAPEEFRLQVAEGDFASGEHTDHIHTTEFVVEALAEFESPGFTVSHYVNYQSNLLEVNLSPEEAAFALEVMETYAAHDPGALDEEGNLLPIYVDWSARQYIAETYTSEEIDDPVEPPAPPPDPVEPVPVDEPVDGTTFSLGSSPDDYLFEVNTLTGEITPKDWFVPSLGRDLTS